MGQPFPTQHPAVVLRSHFKLVRGLLAVAMAAIVALSAAVVIVANDDDAVTGQIAQPADLPALPSSAVHSHPMSQPDARYDGGPEEGIARSITSTSAQAPAARYDGGPDESTRSLATPTPAPAPERTSGSGADESTDRVIVIPQGPGGPR